MAGPPRSDARPLRLRFGREVFPLALDRAVVGRSRSCEIRLKEDTVSRLHAAFVWRAEGLILEDLGSSNGTYLNGDRVLNPRTVTAGDAVRFGALRGIVEAADAPVPGPEADVAPEEEYDYTVGMLPGRPAGLGWRLLALLTDLVLFGAGSVIPFSPLLAALLAERYLLSPDVIPPSLETKAVIAGGCGALWVFYAWFYVIHGWARRGGTPGLRLCGLRLADWRRRVPIGYARAWLRVGACLVVALTGGLGLFTVALRRDRKALHDLLAGTQVIHRPHLLGGSGPTA